MGYLLCLFNAVGVPILTRNYGIATPALPLLGLFSAIATATANQKIPISEILTGTDLKISFRMYQDSMLMVLLHDGEGIASTDEYQKKLMSFLYDAFTLMLGIVELNETVPNDKIMRQLRATYDLVDVILKEEETIFGMLLDSADVMYMKQEHKTILHESLESFLVKAGKKEILGAAMFINGKVGIATNSWWDRLKPVEVVLLSVLIKSMKVALCRDVPVYLPYFAPPGAKPATIPFRLLTFHIMQGIELCILCGKEPAMQQVEEKLIRESFLGKSMSILLQYTQMKPRDIWPQMILDPGIKGFLFLNKALGRAVTSFYTEINNTNTTVFKRSTKNDMFAKIETPDLSLAKEKIKERQELLASFYKTSLEFFWGAEEDSVTVSETYLQTRDYGLVALRREPHYELYVLYSEQVPIFAFTGVAEELLYKLVSNVPF